MENFPYKTLIWAFVVIVAFFVFREALDHLIRQTEEITILGTSIKVTKNESNSLKEAQEKYELQMDSLKQEINALDNAIAHLSAQANKLVENPGTPSSAAAAADSLKSGLDNLKETNIEITARSKILDKPVILSPKSRRSSERDIRQPK